MKPDFSSATPLMLLGLSPREAEVLFWVAQGKMNSDIGAILNISESTVKKHMLKVLAQLGVETRSAATLRALEILSSRAGKAKTRIKKKPVKKPFVRSDRGCVCGASRSVSQRGTFEKLHRSLSAKRCQGTQFASGWECETCRKYGTCRKTNVLQVPWQLKRKLCFRWSLRLVEDDTAAVLALICVHPWLKFFT